MINFGLLLAGRDLIDGLFVKRQSFFLFLFKAVEDARVRKHHPVQHVTSIMHFVERLQKQARVLLLRKEIRRPEVHRLALHRFHLRRDILLFTRKHRRLIERFQRSGRDMAPATVIGDKTVQVSRSRLCRKHNRAMQKCHVIAYARQIFDMRVHRVKYFDNIARFPRLSSRNIARRCRFLHDGIAIDDDLESIFLDPVRMADLHIEFTATRNRELGTFALREGRLLLDFNTLVFPIQHGSRKEVHVKRIFIFRINKLVVLRRIFHAGTHAAPHARIDLGIHAVMARTRRSEIHIAAVFRVDCRKDMVEQRTFIEVGVMRIVLDVEQTFRQLEHVVSIAGFRSFAFFHEFFVIVERREMFRNAVAANRDTALVHDRLPEKVGALRILLVARKFRNSRKAYNFGHLRIRMHVRQVIVPLRHRVQKPLMRPLLCSIQILFVFREVIGIGIDFGHAAMFRAEHLLHLGIVEAVRNCNAPVAKFEEHRLCVLVARINVGVTQTRKKFVDIVPRHPIAVLRTRIAVFHLEPHRFAVRHAADVTHEIRILGILVLNRLELRQDVFETFLDLNIVIIGIMHRQSAQVMPQNVAIKPRPVREFARLGAHPRFFVKRRQKAIDIVTEERFDVQVLTFLQDAVQKLHIRQREHVRIQHILRKSKAAHKPRQGESRANTFTKPSELHCFHLFSLVQGA